MLCFVRKYQQRVKRLVLRLPLGCVKVLGLLLICSTILGVSQVAAQVKDDIVFGVKGGVSASTMSGVAKMVYSRPIYSGYTMDENPTLSPLLTVFISPSFRNSRVRFLAELSYIKQGVSVKYNDINSLRYTLDFKYETLSIGTYLKYYLYKGLNAGLGGDISFVLSPQGIEYKSNHEDIYGPDLDIQQGMRNSFTGRTNVALGINLAYEFSNNITVEASYHYGLTDAVRTEVNDYKFIEVMNRLQRVQLTVGYIFSTDGFSFR